MNINILKKNKKFLIITTVVITLIYLAFYVVNKLSYRYRVDDVFAEKVASDLKSVPGFFGKDIMYIPPIENKSEVIQWGNKLIRTEEESADEVRDSSNITVHSIDFIKTSIDGGKTWDVLYEFDIDTQGCFIGTIYKEKIICIVGKWNTLLIDEDGTLTKNTKSLLDKKAMIDEILAIYTKNDKLVVIWRDLRAQFSTFSPSPPFFYGPYLIMAGELNLDTLEFKEHIIKYDSYIFP